MWEVTRKYEPQLANAGFFRRLYLLMKIHREVKEHVRHRMRTAAPKDAP